MRWLWVNTLVGLEEPDLKVDCAINILLQMKMWREKSSMACLSHQIIFPAETYVLSMYEHCHVCCAPCDELDFPAQHCEEAVHSRRARNSLALAWKPMLDPQAHNIACCKCVEEGHPIPIPGPLSFLAHA
jgi:hypothetical protein